MSIEKSIDLTATGESFDAAVTSAIHRASLTLKGITGFEIERVEGLVDDGVVTYKVHLRVSFTIKERLHE